ncbi:hypothetical protein [Streptomyces sp. TE5632]
MFTETVESPDSTSTGTVSEPRALLLLRRANRRGYAIQPLRDGGAAVRYRMASSGRPKLFVHTFTPTVPAGDLTDADRLNLHTIDEVKAARFTGTDGARAIAAGMYEIPPARAGQLAGRGLLAAEQDGSLRLTLPARLALVAAAHGRVDSSDRTTVRCSCGLTVQCKNAERADVRRLSHLAAVAADFLDSLSTAFTAAVAAV